MAETIGEIAQALVAPGKGILAADESTGTIKKRFDAIGVESTEANRLSYRESLFTSPGIGDYISGVILYDETLRQTAPDGRSIPRILQSQGVIPGIKVDEGIEALAESPEEKVTKGLDGLADRLKEYYSLGARFAKWRAVIKIGENIPTDECIAENAKRLARYAKICQTENFVPIVEPEVLMDGAHSIERCYDVTRKVLVVVFSELQNEGVALSGLLLKPNMVIAASAAPEQVLPGKVAELTLKCFADVVPPAVPGIVFLSGGQSEAEACANLNAMNVAGMTAPWQRSFSYGRALQASALQAWRGKPENIPALQRAFLRRARLTSLACQGQYSEEMEGG